MSVRPQHLKDAAIGHSNGWISELDIFSLWSQSLSRGFKGFRNFIAEIKIRRSQSEQELLSLMILVKKWREVGFYWGKRVVKRLEKDWKKMFTWLEVSSVSTPFLYRFNSSTIESVDWLFVSLFWVQALGIWKRWAQSNSQKVWTTFWRVSKGTQATITPVAVAKHWDDVEPLPHDVC